MGRDEAATRGEDGADGQDAHLGVEAAGQLDELRAVCDAHDARESADAVAVKPEHLVETDVDWLARARALRHLLRVHLAAIERECRAVNGARSK